MDPRVSFSTHPEDDEDVRWALSTASALWARGEQTEALKWLRRAAETASENDRDLRAVELFKAAADLANHNGSPLSVPPPQSVPPPVRTGAPPARSAPPPNHRQSLPPQQGHSNGPPPMRQSGPPQQPSGRPPAPQGPPVARAKPLGTPLPQGRPQGQHAPPAHAQHHQRVRVSTPERPMPAATGQGPTASMPPATMLAGRRPPAVAVVPQRQPSNAPPSTRGHAPPPPPSSTRGAAPSGAPPAEPTRLVPQPPPAPPTPRSEPPDSLRRAATPGEHSHIERRNSPPMAVSQVAFDDLDENTSVLSGDEIGVEIANAIAADAGAGHTVSLVGGSPSSPHEGRRATLHQPTRAEELAQIERNIARDSEAPEAGEDVSEHTLLARGRTDEVRLISESLASFRVAIASGPHGLDVVHLREGEAPRAGAAIAYLVPADRHSADTLLRLLAARKS